MSRIRGGGNTRSKRCTYLAAGLLAGAFAAGSAAAQSVVTTRAAVSAAKVEAYWTPERLKSAVPMDMPAADPSKKPSAAPASKGAPQRHLGSAPTLDVGDDLKRQLFASKADKRSDARSEAEPTNFGTAGFYFTTSRLFPPAAAKAYPNSAAGQLFFSDIVHGGNFVCSASAISYRLVVTAGHCVAHGDPSAPHFYANLLFVPATANGSAPYKQWPWTGNAVTTANWYFSGSVPNVQDVAIFETADQNYKHQLSRLGTVTGWLGWWTLGGRQLLNHVTQLGYPCNLDSCQLEQINTAGGVRIVSNNLEIGSAMQGGSSGGPWIQDYGVYPNGGPAYTAGNWVLAATSYQYFGASVLGASIFENAGYGGGGFVDLWNVGCSWRVDNC